MIDSCICSSYLVGFLSLSIVLNGCALAFLFIFLDKFTHRSS